MATHPSTGSEAIIHRATMALPSLVLGGAGFSYQNHRDPQSVPVLDIVKQAFDRGLRAIDTSPYYDPSEQMLGAALSHPNIASHYNRTDYFLITKVGRIGAEEFDYSPNWINSSVERSLLRLGTSYLDVVFCHDVEFVRVDEALEAIGALLELKKRSVIRFVGISGYTLEVLIKLSAATLRVFDCPVDVVQTWA